MRGLVLAVGVAAMLSLAPLAAAQSNADEDAARAQVMALFKMFKGRDWKTMFSSCEFSAKVRSGLTTAEAYAEGVEKGIKQNDPEDNFGKLFNGMTDIFIGKAVIEGKSAYVATTCVVKMDGQATLFLGIAKMVKSGEMWKWDLSFTDDLEKATQQRLVELIGTVVTKKSG